MNMVRFISIQFVNVVSSSRILCTPLVFSFRAVSSTDELDGGWWWEVESDVPYFSFVCTILNSPHFLLYVLSLPHC